MKRNKNYLGENEVVQNPIDFRSRRRKKMIKDRLRSKRRAKQSLKEVVPLESRGLKEYDQAA